MPVNVRDKHSTDFIAVRSVPLLHGEPKGTELIVRLPFLNLGILPLMLISDFVETIECVAHGRFVDGWQKSRQLQIECIIKEEVRETGQVVTKQFQHEVPITAVACFPDRKMLTRLVQKRVKEPGFETR